MEDLVMRQLTAAVAVTAVAVTAAALLTAGCSTGTSDGTGTASQPPSPATLPPDQRTTAALLQVATAFNNNYDDGRYGPAYDRWDARSQAIISRADYVRRHQECPSGPVTAQTEDAEPGGPGGSWIVHYQIDGQQLTDYWFYAQRRWAFDLILSNPDSVTLYRMTAQQYVKAQGCTH
jgi:hypothetical protein